MPDPTTPAPGLRVAALFVQSDGVYASMPDVDPWPESRDARTYAGPLPVVAHPPCQRWGRLGAVNFQRWGGQRNRPGNDGGCFASALASVRSWPRRHAPGRAPGPTREGGEQADALPSRGQRHATGLRPLARHPGSIQPGRG